MGLAWILEYVAVAYFCCYWHGTVHAVIFRLLCSYMYHLKCSKFNWNGFFQFSLLPSLTFSFLHPSSLPPSPSSFLPFSPSPFPFFSPPPLFSSLPSSLPFSFPSPLLSFFFPLSPYLSFPFVLPPFLLLPPFLKILPIIGLALNGANVIGYIKCRRDAGARISAMAGQFIGKQILKQVHQFSVFLHYQDNS